MREGVGKVDVLGWNKSCIWEIIHGQVSNTAQTHIIVVFESWTRMVIIEYLQKKPVPFLLIEKHWWCRICLTLNKASTVFYVYIPHYVESFLFLFYAYIFCNKILFIY